jgi:hypothetical protein
MTIQLFTTPHKLAKLSYALFRETLLQSAGSSWGKRQVLSSTLAAVPQVRVRSLDANLGPHPNPYHATLADALHFLKPSFTKRLPGLTGETVSFSQKRYYDRNVQRRRRVQGEAPLSSPQPPQTRVAWPRRLSQTSRVPRPSSAWAGLFIGHRPPSAPGADSWSASPSRVGGQLGRATRHPQWEWCTPKVVEGKPLAATYSLL